MKKGLRLNHFDDFSGVQAIRREALMKKGLRPIRSAIERNAPSFGEKP